MELASKQPLQRKGSIFTPPPTGMVDSAWSKLAEAGKTPKTAGKSPNSLAATFAELRSASEQHSQQFKKSMLRVNTAANFSIVKQQASTAPLSSKFSKSRAKSRTPSSSANEPQGRSRAAYWNGQLAQKAEHLMSSEVLQTRGVVKLLGGRVGPPRHLPNGSIDYTNLGHGTVNFPEIADYATNKTPKRRLAVSSEQDRSEADLVRVVTAGVPLNEPALSNLTPVQLAILEIEKARAKTHGRLIDLKRGQHRLRAPSKPQSSSALHFSIRHKSALPATQAKEHAVAKETVLKHDDLVAQLGEVQYISDSETSVVSQAEEKAPCPEQQRNARASKQPLLRQTPAHNSFKDEILSVASDSTWVPMWSKTRHSVSQRAACVVAEAKDSKSRKQLIQKRAAARRKAVRLRYNQIQDQYRQRAVSAATLHERRKDARKREEARKMLATAISVVAKSSLWWNIMSSFQLAQQTARKRKLAARRIVRWVEQQLEAKVATKAAKDRLIVSMFIKRYIWKTRRHKKQRLSVVVLDFLKAVRRFGSRTRLLMQSKRYFAAVSIITSAWRRLRAIIDSEQRLLGLLWEKHERDMLHPVYNALSRAQQRRSSDAHDTIHTMDEETLALYDTQLAKGDFEKLAIATPRCIVQRVTRMHLFYMRQEFRDCTAHNRAVVEMMQPFLHRKRRQLELAQRLAFHGSPSSFMFDESALAKYLPPPPEPFKAFLSKKRIQELILHTRANLDKRVANADSWYLKRRH